MTLSEVLSAIQPGDQAAMDDARARWDSVAKPLGSLGVLEGMIIRIAGAVGSSRIDLGKKAVVAMCADNGVVAQGVTQTGQEVTAVVTENMSRGTSSVCRMAKIAGADVIPVDIGVAQPVSGHNILQRNIRRGTADLSQGPAMTREECERAILTGVDIVKNLDQEGYRLIATGEMGIGNTTTSSAVLSALFGLDPAVLTGRGAGLSTQGLQRKIEVIRQGIQVNRPDRNDPVDVLYKVGGLDIAGLTGVFLGGALYRIPVLIDGLISSVAALCAQRLCPAAKDYQLASHASAEPAGRTVLDELGLEAVLYADMRLGEGTGAVAVMPILDMALAIYRDMSTFQQMDIDAYEHLT